jgi:hypothetical protein
LASVYELHPQDLGDLLLYIGNALGRSAPALREPDEASSTAITAANPQAVAVSPLEPKPAGTTRPLQRASCGFASLETVATVRGDGWITIPLTRVHFPSLCCACGGPGAEGYKIEVDEGFDWFRLVPLIGRAIPEKTVELTVPFCRTCHRRHLIRQVFLAILPVGLSLAPLGVLLSIAYAGLDVCFGMILFVVALVLARLSSFQSLYVRSPFQARYNAPARTVSFRFRNGMFTERLLAQGFSKGDDC